MSLLRRQLGQLAGKVCRPLKDVNVIELEGLAPVPFCGLMLADFGANVTVIKAGEI